MDEGEGLGDRFAFGGDTKDCDFREKQSQSQGLSIEIISIMIPTWKVIM